MRTFFFVLLLSLVPSLASANNSYVTFGIGGDIVVDGDLYASRDPRFAISTELGTKFAAFPISVSFGQDSYIFGVKPRAQYLVKLPNLEKLSAGPGLGFVFNYWNVDVGSFFVQDLDVIELGMQLSAIIQYDVNDKFFLQFVPMAFDFNFWRYLWINSNVLPGSGTEGSNDDFGMIYNILASVGYRF